MDCGFRVSDLSDFDLDLETGKEGEEFVRSLRTGRLTVEVKRDLRWKDTGNLYIESQYWSKTGVWVESGISITKAAYWAFVLQGSVLIVPTDVLKNVVSLWGKPIDCIIPPNPSRGYLVQPEDLLEMMKFC